MKELHYLTIEELKLIKEVELKSERLEKVRDIFVFCCLTGLNYIDLKRLSWNNFHKEGETIWIRINHAKTKLEMNIPLDNVAIDILNKYQTGNHYLLPIISHQKMNAYLKELSGICKIGKNLTLMIAHKTFPILMLSCGYPRHVISTMLGHVQNKSMCKYLKTFHEALI